MTLTKIKTDGVTDDAITSGKIPANAVGSSEIADTAVTLAKLEHGTSSNNGKFLRANNGADPSFETVTSTTINNNANNRVITGSDSADTLNSESALTFNNSTDTLLIHQTDTGNNPAFKSIHRGGAGSQINAHFTNYSGTNHTVILHDGSIGIGTQTPVTSLHCTHPTDNGVALFESGDASGGIALKDNSTTNNVFLLAETDDFKLLTGGSERLRLDSSGRLLIGSTDGATYSEDWADDFIVGSTANGKNDGITILSGTSQNGSLAFADSGGASRGLVGYVHNGDYLRFHTAATERIRIDSSGNVGIGKTPYRKLDIDTSHYVVTSSGQSTTGIHLDGTHGNAGEYGGGISFACGGAGSAAIAARQATSSQHVVGLSFFTHDSSFPSDNAVEKVRIHDGGTTSFNNGIGLGNGLTYAASNTLDDYEEGVFTVGVSCPSGSVTLHSGYNEASYTKVGRLVHVMAYLVVSSISSPSGTLTLTGLPFTSADTQDKSAAARFPISMYLNGSSLPDGQGTYTGSAYVNEGVTELSINFVGTNTSGKQTNNCADQLAGGSDFFLNFSYIT